ncbi:MAG: alpha-glucosidase family protein [Rhodobiaceae bacterium]|nr:alpha-glucosidase family protein [Rhodobiaceae bacterium]
MSGSEKTPWWKGAVVYQIYPRSYADTTGSGVGDLEGIKRKLDYVASLGVDAIWLSPIYPSPNKDFGYDVADYCDVAPEMGTLDGFDALLAETHERGMKLILDQVLAHSSDQHAWFQESLLSPDNEKANWYVWADAKEDGTPPNNWMSAFGGPAWSWHPVRRQYYHHKFLRQQPKLNFHEPEAVKALMNVLRFWLDRGVDGFRLDVAHAYYHDATLADNPPVPMAERSGLNWSHAPRLQEHVHDSGLPENQIAMRAVRSVLDEYEDRLAFGEFAETPEMIGTYVGEPDLLHTAYTFDFLEDRSLAPSVFQNYYQDTLKKNGDPWPCVTFSNHDLTRPATRWGSGRDGDDKLAKFGLALLLALKGTVLLYQGEELGLPDVDIERDQIQDPVGELYFPFGKGRDGCRTPMPWISRAPNAAFTDGEPWLPIPEVHKERAVDVQEAVTDTVLKFAREAISFRKAHACLSSGNITFLESSGPVLAFERLLGGETLTCVFNSSNEAAVWHGGAASEVILKGSDSLEFGTGDVSIVGTEIICGPRSAAFFGDPSSS